MYRVGNIAKLRDENQLYLFGSISLCCQIAIIKAGVQHEKSASTTPLETCGSIRIGFNGCFRCD